MRSRISNQFLRNYLIAFLLSLVATFFALVLLALADGMLSKTLIKNIYPAKSLMRDDYQNIDAHAVVQHGGGVQVVDKVYRVAFSEGLDALGKTQLTAAEFTDFLIKSKSKGVTYSYDILYNENEDFWLIVTFPTSIRLDFAVAFNKDAPVSDMRNVSRALLVVFILYLMLLALFALIFSRMTSARVTGPLKKLCEGTKRLREGDYSVRVNLGLKNEFAELEQTFNEMADRIEHETARRIKSEKDRQKMLLDISHDLKNPLASISGYAELCLQNQALSPEQAKYLQIIHSNSQRAGHLLNDLFELARLESPEFTLKLTKTDICEYLRVICGELLPMFEHAGFDCEFDIPEKPILMAIDTAQLSRVFYNLAQNAIRYNTRGITVSIGLHEEGDNVVMCFKDSGKGMPKDAAKDIFKPFVRLDDSRNSQTGGSGLGLSIAEKIITAHGGSLKLDTDSNKGCAFFIFLPRI